VSWDADSDGIKVKLASTYISQSDTVHFAKLGNGYAEQFRKE